MKRVIVFCTDSPYSLFLVRSLGEAGYRPECYCVGHSCSFLFLSRYTGKHRKFDNVTDALNFLLNDYPEYDDKPVLFAFPDIPAYYADLHVEELEKKFILMSAGQSGGIVHWMSKKNIGALAVKHGLTIPWTVELAKDEQIPEALEYPVFTKNIASVDGGKQDEGICHNRKELEQRQKAMSSDRFLVMKYIEKDNEINYFGLALNGRIYIDYNDECKRFRADSYGHYTRFSLCKKDALYNNIVSMMKETGYNGLFDVEFLLGKDGVLYFTEVNFRTDGAIYKLTQGVNLPAEWCRLTSLPVQELPQSLKTGKETFSAMEEFRDFKENVLTGRMNVFLWLKEFFAADIRNRVSLRDPLPFFCWIADGVRSFVGKTFAR